MNRLHKIILSLLILLFVFSTNVMAKNNIDIDFEKIEYTKEYQKWLELPEEERENLLPPNKYNIDSNNKKIINSTNNPFTINRILKNSYQPKFSLKDVLGDKMKIKDQGNTNTCWAFATLGTLETTLSYQDYKNNTPVKEYDFSERHMVYSNTRNAFLNNQINEFGYTKDIDEGSNYYLALNYLVNGKGAILESNMPFKDDLNNIDISEIQNKDVITTIYDTQEFDIEDRNELISEMKSYLSSYGGLYVQIHGADLDDDKYYNNLTGAICTDSQATMDHAVVLIGWDDDYNKDNFNENCRPQNNGAWIIKNSWGEKIELVLDEIKKENYLANEDEYIQMEIYSYEELPDDYFIDLLIKAGYTPNEDNTVFSLNIGDNGYMYVSYEDALIYNSVCGFKNATNTKDYDIIYQNDILGWSNILRSSYSGTGYIANCFTRDTSNSEKIDKVSIDTPIALNNCKVYINPNGQDKGKEKLQEVRLKGQNLDNNTIDIDSGFHIIELEEPIELNSDSFVVVLEMNSSEEATYIALESVTDGGWENAIVNGNESFFTIGEGFENNEWVDLGLLADNSLRGNVTLKAYTEKSSTQNSDSDLDGEQEPGENDNNNNDNNDDDNNNNNNENEDNEQIQKQPKSSDFSKSKANLESIKFSDTEAQVLIKVDNIIIGDEEDNYTYYYCITPSSLNDNISSNYWNDIPVTNISKQSDGTYTIDLDIDLLKQKNIAELYSKDKLYLHIKEVAELNGQKAESVNAFDILVNFSEIPSKEENNNSDNATNTTNTNTTNTNNQNSTKENTNSNEANDVAKDATVANNILPYTGKINILIAISLIIILGGFLYYKYRNIDR